MGEWEVEGALRWLVGRQGQQADSGRGRENSGLTMGQQRGLSAQRSAPRRGSKETRVEFLFPTLSTWEECVGQSFFGHKSCEAMVRVGCIWQSIEQEQSLYPSTRPQSTCLM